jgi:hypothetical protein
MKYLQVAVAVLLMACTAWALDDTADNRGIQADRYLETTPPRDLFQDVAEQVSANLPPPDRQRYKDLMTKHLDIDALTKAIKVALVNHFTADELKALADFYGSSVGKSAMKKFGAYMTEVMPSIQAEMGKAEAKANREMSGTRAKE